MRGRLAGAGIPASSVARWTGARFGARRRELYDARMIDPRITSITLNSRAGAAVSRAIGRQNAARKAEQEKAKPATQTTIKAPK